jgi:hypothetical protein
VSLRSSGQERKGGLRHGAGDRPGGASCSLVEAEEEATALSSLLGLTTTARAEVAVITGMRTCPWIPWSRVN